MGQYVDFYCGNENKELKKIVNPILMKNFAWIPQKDYDDFYSIASMVVWDCEKKFDSKKVKTKKFKSFISTCIHNKIKTHITYMNRSKRMMRDEDGNPLNNSSLDVPNEDGVDLCEKVASDFQLEDNLDSEDVIGENTISYLKALSPRQKEIAKLIMRGYNDSDYIKRKLGLTDKQYINDMKHMTCSKNTNILTKTSNKTEEKDMKNNQVVNQTNEKSKVEKLSIASIIKKMNNGTLRYDHPLQRESDQHSTKMKSNLMSDILQGNPIPALVFAEQVINGISITWNLDGKQRSTNVKEFTEDKFKITKSVRRNLIKYQAIIKDENGNMIPDEKGFPQAEWREFDIANKKFSQLPDELKDKFMDYCFDITLYMNCSDEDIAYHIERYNDGKQMASSQKGVIKLGEDYALMIKGISAMPFFKGNGFNYTQSKNGSIDRVCIESIMATEFLDSWKKTPEEIADFLKKNATEEHFDNLEDTVERLEKVVTDNIGEMFDINDSFIYFSVFARFKKLGLDDEKFVEFMTEYAQSLHNMMKETEIDSETGKKKSTKDKIVVVDKINMVENLMNEFLHINKEDLKEISVVDFVKENVNPDVTDEDVEFYSEILDDITLEVDNDTKLLDEHNRPSLVALVGYACQNDIDDKLVEWIKEFFVKNFTYKLNQRENFVYMKNSLQKMAVA